MGVRQTLAVTLNLLAVQAAWAQDRIELASVARIVRLAEPRVSPDGRAVALLVSRANFEDNRYDRELVLVDVGSGAQRVLTSDRRDVGHARWSPSGDRLAFLATVGSGPEAGRQVFVMPMNAGGEARRLTDAPSGVEGFAWRPDSAEIAYTAADPPEKRTGEERHNDSFEVGNNDFLARTAPTPRHVWLVAAGGGSPRRLTSGPWSVATGLASPALSWSADRGRLALVRFPTPHSGDTDQGTVHLVDVVTGGVRALTGRAGREDAPLFSPGGAQVAYVHPRDGDPANVDEVFVAPAGGGEGVSATRELDRHVSGALWMPDSTALVVVGTDGTRGALWRQPLGGRARRLELGPVRSVAGVSVGRTGAIAFVGSEASRPSELYFMATSDSAPRRLTDFNRETAVHALGRTETIEWRTSDRLPADGVLTYPPDFQPGRRYPLVLLLHGGPTSSSTEAFSPRAQLMAARGWLVFQPNYRGSDNRGNAFQRAIAGDAGGGPGRDVMEGLEAVKRRGIVDEARLAASGWSYGGFMTVWLIGRYPGWRAAVAGAAPIDIGDMYSISDLNVMRRHAIVDSPWVGDNGARYFAQSPIAHLSKIRTPTLILSNAGDARVPVVGSYKLYRALRDNGVPTRFVVYPTGGHGPADPVRARDVDRRWLEWLEKHLGPS